MLGTDNLKKIHLVGVGGAGMSGIAEILINMDYEVSGSDIHSSQITDRLQSLGLTFFNFHDKKNLKNVDLVVFSSAIDSNNPELIEAKNKEINTIRRAEMLAHLTSLRESIIFAGSHGKTTTTCIAAHIFKENNLDPTYIIGGKVSSFESNANLGSGRHILAEADESDGSFLLFTPDKAVITSIDNDHLEAYGQSVKKLEFSFIEFIQKVKKKVFIYDEKKALIKNLTSELNLSLIHI